MPLLFALETGRLRLTWSRRREKAVPLLAAPCTPPFGLRIRPLHAGPAPVVRLTTTETHLFEQTEYTLFAQSRDGAPVGLRHRDPVLLRGLQAGDGILHGTLNFGAQVGFSRFTVEVGGVPQFSFRVEVFPSKVDYRRDYAALRDDVRAVAAELALEPLGATHTPGRADARPGRGVLAWLALLRREIDGLDRALTYVARRPQWDVLAAVTEQRADRIRRTDPTLHQALARDKGHGPRRALTGGRCFHERLPTHAGRYTLDTPAHRWLAARMHRLQQRLTDLYREEARLRPGPRRRAVLDELDALRHRLVQLNRLPVLQEADGPPPADAPLRLLTAPGYREAYRACLRLHQGLDLGAGPLDLGLKDVHLLYEYWCFLTVARLIAQQCEDTAPLRSLLAVEQVGLRLRLRRGRAHTLRFPTANGRVALTYNPRFGGRGYLVPQQPDLLLTVYAGDAAPARYVLDAKYRLDASPAYRRRYGIPGPPTDALNDLHRYRDAIQDPGSDRRAVIQAVALYPYRETAPGEYARSAHYRLLTTLGVGALPLLPDATDYLAAWLGERLGNGHWGMATGEEITPP